VVLYVANTISQVNTSVAVLTSKVQDHSQAIADIQQQLRAPRVAQTP
jgi:cell division protein FtsL